MCVRHNESSYMELALTFVAHEKVKSETKIKVNNLIIMNSS